MSTTTFGPLEVFPAIDLMDGKAVRLSQGRRDSATIYSDAPWNLVADFVAAGAARIHVVDLDAAFSGGQQHNRGVIEKIARASSVAIEVGGGVRSADDCAALLDLGARFVVLGTVAIKDPDLTARLCALHPNRVVIALDANNGQVAVEGWTESTKVTAVDCGRTVAAAGAAAVLYTDIGRDGMRTGPNIEATRVLADAIAPCPVIASGGVATLDDLDDVARTGARAVIIGRAIYEGAFTAKQAVERAHAIAHRAQDE